MDICHLKNAELDAKHQKYKGRVVLRGDIVKDDSGSFAVFTEQGSSASQMTAARVVDIISRLPGCTGQAADSVSAYTMVKMEDAPKLLKIPKSECPDTWIRLPRHKWPKSWSSMEDPVVLLERNLYGHLWQDCYGKGNLRKSFWSTAGRRFLIGNAYSYTVKNGYSYVCMWMAWNWLANVFLGSCVLGVYSKDNVKQAKMLWTITEPRLNQGFAREQLKNYHARKICESLRSLLTWKVMPRNVWNEFVSWQYKTTQQLYKVSTPCIDDHHPTEEEFKSVRELSPECFQIVLKCLYFHDRLQNGPRLVTNACIDWFLTFIIHVNTNSIGMWVIPCSAANCLWIVFLPDGIIISLTFVVFLGIN